LELNRIFIHRLILSPGFTVILMIRVNSMFYLNNMEDLHG